MLALVNNEDYEACYSYTTFGKLSTNQSLNCELDLFFAPEKKSGWINIYKDDDIAYASMDIFKTKKKAESASCSTCIATVKIEWEE